MKFPVALVAHHTPTSKPCIRTSCIIPGKLSPLELTCPLSWNFTAKRKRPLDRLTIASGKRRGNELLSGLGVWRKRPDLKWLTSGVIYNNGVRMWGWLDWIWLAQDRVQQWAVLQRVYELEISTALWRQSVSNNMGALVAQSVTWLQPMRSLFRNAKPGPGSPSTRLSGEHEAWR